MDKVTAKQKITELVTRFAENIDSYKNVTYNETQTRREFIDPFFEAFGWDVDNKQGLAEAYKEVIHEYKIDNADIRQSPDYCFTLYGQEKFFVEAKKPSVNIKQDVAPAYQVRSYAWSAGLPISIVTDFEEFAVYDCSKKPSVKDKAETARIEYFTFNEYLGKFDFLWDTFSKERVLQGSFDKYVSADKGNRGKETVGKEFLKLIEEWRKNLANNIAANNNLSDDELNFAVQQTIDRIIFLIICEDRKIEPPYRLKELAAKPDIYKNLFKLFREADEKYNSGLFDFRKDTISAKIIIDDKKLKTLLDELYNSPYQFSRIPVEILGSVYEQFLGKVIRQTKAGAVIDDKPEVKVAGGVFYTPQYVVNYIVKNTVSTVINGKTPKEIQKIKIVDPACGSGSFLIGAYQYLLDYHQKYYLNNPKKNNPLTPAGQLTTAEKKRILLNNIYGVDIDAQAVEVTKLSLLLQALDGETEASINEQLSLYRERVLPTLDDNIKCGNSLIGTDFYAQQGQLFSTNDKKINAFDWKTEFAEVFKNGGFDVVIGNPPYVRMQTIDKQQTDYFNSKYKSAGYGNYDLYILFIELSLKMLSRSGLSGMILPHKFFQADYGKGTREIIAAGRNVFQINDFTTNQIFESATTYTCLLFLSKHSNDRFSYQRIELGLDPKNALQKINLEPISSNKLNKKWTFNNSVKEALLDKIGKHKVTLKDISEKIFKGSSTGNDKVYLLRMISQKKQTSVVFSEILNEKIEIENKILKPFIYGLNVRRFYVNHDNIYLLFPYNIEKDKAFLIDLSKFPLTAKYLECVKKILTQRKLKFTKNDFYKYSAGRSLTEYEKEKILIPDMLVESRIGIDLLGRYYHGPAIHSLILKEQYSWLNLRYILAILSSKLFWFFISSTSTALRGNAYRLTPEYINLFPIKIINKNDKKECEKHTEIIQLVDQMLELKKQEKIETVPQSKTIIQRKITAVDNAIDKLVYALYGLTGEENKIIEKKNEEIQ